MKIISLGWGVQSFTMAAMSALGELEQVDYAIHADTLHENSGTYKFAEKWTSWLDDRGVKVITVKNPMGGIWEIMRTKPGQTHVPLYTLEDDGDAGKLRRSCTYRWKVVPMRRWTQKHRYGARVEQWIGISTDEALRMRPSDVKYIYHRWPLIEKGMSRNDCKRWLLDHGLEIPPRSSCVFCPFHDFSEWRNIKLSTNGDWNEATMVDDAVRDLRPPYKLYVHPARVPLSEIDFESLEDKGQLRLWDEECEGLCGI